MLTKDIGQNSDSDTSAGTAELVWFGLDSKLTYE